MKKANNKEPLERTAEQESADSLLTEAMKLPGVADYFSVFGEYQKHEASVASYFSILNPSISWNTSDTSTP
ncbi:MAG TPA: hypothetical protein ACFYD3_10615 [Candidatus Hypogeohydataceae bacterium YC41]